MAETREPRCASTVNVLVWRTIFSRSPPVFRLRRTLTTIIAALGCAATTDLAGQSAPAATTRPIPPRPVIDAGADTNNPRSYVVWATGQLRRRPEQAAAAFYWATRLEPNYAEAFYGLHVARLLANTSILIGWVEGDRGTLSSPGVRAIDSLRYRAQAVDPFFREDLDDVLVEFYYVEVIIRENPTLSRTEVQYEIRNLLDRSRDPYTRAWLAATRGNYREALRIWADLARNRPRNYTLRTVRARAFMQLGNADSAVTELRAAITAARAADTTRMWHVYDSKEALEFSLGWIQEQRRDTAGAREAYQRALVENLGFWPAHVRLGLLAMAARDTATAFREMRAALDIREDDYNARLMMGFLAGTNRRFDEAVLHLTRAAEIEPFAAAPWDIIGQIQDAAGRRAEAIAAYERFLRLASRNDSSRPPVEGRLAVLRGR